MATTEYETDTKTQYLADQIAELQAQGLYNRIRVIDSPMDGHVVINSTGNPALASAGSGDVLAGICGALMAQGWHVWNAALAAVWLHGHAADMLVNQGIGPIGVTANEIIPEARSALNQIVKSHSNFSA